MPYSLGIYTLGCKVNQYESEAIAQLARRQGFVINAPTEPCDAYIINTCTVTAESDRKSRQLIRRARSANPEAKIVVMGCMSQVDPGSVLSIDGVSCVLGNSDKLTAVDEIAELLKSAELRPPFCKVSPIEHAPFEPMRIDSFPRTRAYIKIEDGCESHCTYCIIPSARGKIRSKPRADVLAELEQLAKAGCREVVLTGIETASYGVDLDNYRLADLLVDADKLLGGDVRVRLGSLDPSLMKPAFIERIAPLRSLTPHFHLSMQSGSSEILAKMKRKYNADMARVGISRLREAIPELQLTTDIIVGFPGESDESFAETLDFMREIRFLDAHIFAYSKRKGTPASQMADQVPDQKKKERSAALIKECEKITDEILASQVKKTFPVLFETDSRGVSVGHTPSFIEVRVRSDEMLHGEIRDVEITGASRGYCEAKLIK